MARGYRYDSSVFPSWPYYMAKAGVMAMMSLVGRPLALGARRSARADRADDCPIGRAIAVLARAVDAGGAADVGDAGAAHAGDRQLGATFAAVADGGARAPARVDARAPFFNLELHGIDLIGADEDGIPAELVAQQPDLRVSLAHKLRALEATLDRLALDYRFVPLRDVAAEVQREGAVA